MQGVNVRSPLPVERVKIMPKVTLFRNTGYNPANGPAPKTPAAAAVSIGGEGEQVVGSWDIDNLNDPTHLKKIKLPLNTMLLTVSGGVNFRLIPQIDYMRIDGTQFVDSLYYCVTDYEMTSVDVVVFEVFIDPFMSFLYDGFGIYMQDGRLKLPKGIVRRTNSKDVMTEPLVLDDIYKITDTPIYKVDGIYLDTSATGARNTVKLVALNIQPHKVYNAGLVKQIGKITQADGITTEETLPGEGMDPPGPSHITFKLPLLDGSIVSSYDFEWDTDGYALYNFELNGVLKACTMLQGLNMGDSILGAYEIPATMASITTRYISGQALPVTDVVGTSGMYITPFTPAALYPDMPWADLMYCSGDFTYTLSSSASGDTLTDAAVNCDDHVHMFVDPRPNGRPYFMMPLKNQVTTDRATDTVACLQSRTVQGAAWNNVAVYLSNRAGSEIAELSTTIALNRIKQDSENQSKYNAWAPFLNFIGAEAGNAGDFYQQGVQQRENLGYNPISDIMAGAKAIGGTILNNYGAMGLTEGEAAWFSDEARQRQAAARASIDEALSYISNYGYVSPTVKTQPQTSIQQAIGNGAVFTAQVPGALDMARFGHIFAMFGRKCAIIVAGDYYMNIMPNAPEVYVQMDTTGVGGGYARRIQMDRLKIGYRFWIKPGQNKDVGNPADYWEE